MKYIVTGCLGFIGSYFVKYLLALRKDATVVGIDINTNQKHIKRLGDAVQNKRFTLYFADFSRDVLTDAFDGANYIIHFGAKTFVDYSIRDPQPFIDSNVVGTYRILEEARKLKSLKKYLQFSTDEVYGSILEGSYVEDARLNPTNPYAASKAAGDMLAISYYNTYKTPIIISRTENVYGQFQGKEKAIPVFVKRALQDEPIPVYGDGKHIRQWIYLPDVMTAIMLLLDKGVAGEIYHIAGNQELMNIDLAKMILKNLNKPESLISFVMDRNVRPGHDRRYALNSDKIRTLGWEPKYTLEKGIKETVDWYKTEQWWMI